MLKRFLQQRALIPRCPETGLGVHRPAPGSHTQEPHFPLCGGWPSWGQTEPGSLEGPPGGGGRWAEGSTRLSHQSPGSEDECSAASWGQLPNPPRAPPKHFRFPNHQKQTQHPPARSFRGSSSPVQSPRPTNCRSCFLPLSLMSPVPVSGPGGCWPRPACQGPRFSSSCPDPPGHL